ncbi:MAG: hypothetical protein AB1344_09055 [Pseudomonadota bacterium]
MSNSRVVRSPWSVVGGFVLLALAQPASAAEPAADPLRPDVVIPLAVTDAPGELAAVPRLSMIVRNGHDRLAVIDGQPRRLGERWANYHLLRIHPASVVLGRDGGEPLELGLLSGAVIKKNSRP